MKLYHSIVDLIGNTPIVKLNKIKNKYSLNSNIYAKVESFNPMSSIKDRIALSMIEGAESDGDLKQGMTIVEPTSGNTGIGITYIAKSKGYDVKIVMPETMSKERRKIIKNLGAELILTDGSKGMKGSIAKANEMVHNNKKYMTLNQFANKYNPLAHYENTAPEIWKDMVGNVDIFICGVGTGGTLTGVGKFLKEKNTNIDIIAVEPLNSAVISGEKAGSHKIQGIGAGFIPDNLGIDLIDEIVKVEDEVAYSFQKELASEEGIFAGLSSGAALYALIEIAKRYNGKNILTIFPDTGERYISNL